MRFHTAITASRKSPPAVGINIPPNASFPPEVHVSVGGLSLWLEEAEATALGKQLIEAGIRIRAERPAELPHGDHHDDPDPGDPVQGDAKPHENSGDARADQCHNEQEQR